MTLPEPSADLTGVTLPESSADLTGMTLPESSADLTGVTLPEPGEDQTTDALPESLRARPFTVREALQQGVPRKRLRRNDLDRTVWGVRDIRNSVVGDSFAKAGRGAGLHAIGTRSDAYLAPEDREARALLLDRCRMFASRIRQDAFFSHLTSARLHGIPLPWHLERDERLHISVLAPARAPHAHGIVGHKMTIVPNDIVTVAGLRTTSVERTWCDLGSVLGLHDLVAAGDFLIHWRLPLTSSRRLRRAVERSVNRRGVVLLKRALELLSDRAESPPESVLRVIIILAGLPEPSVNHEVTNARGEFVARIDLVIAEYRLVIEYMGDYHRTVKGQWRADMTRRSKLESQGWKVMEVNANDLRDPDELVARIRRYAKL